MKIKYINEAFKKVAVLKNLANDEKYNSDEEVLKRVKKGAFDAKVQYSAREKLDPKIEDVLLNSNNSIFKKDDNQMKLNNIEYNLINDTVYCKVTIEVNSDGEYEMAGSAHLAVQFPSFFKDLETSISNEFRYKTKLILNFIPSEKHPDYCKHFFSKPRFPRNTRCIKGNFINSDDLSDFCYLLNSIEGIDFNYWILNLSIYDSSSLKFMVKTDVPLKTKFQGIVLRYFKLDEIDLTGLLSEKPVDKYFIKVFGENEYDKERTSGFFEKPITGCVKLILPNAPVGKRPVIYAMDYIEKFQNMSKSMTNYSNLFVTAVLPEQYEYTNTGNGKLAATFTELEPYLVNDYEKLNDLGYDIYKPQNMTLIFKFYISKDILGVFPYISRDEIQENYSKYINSI